MEGIYMQRAQGDGGVFGAVDDAKKLLEYQA